MLNSKYLLVNSTNEFLEEYTDLEENARYKLTNFSGSTGDALVTPDNEIYLFVDGRYHTQADLEVDKSKVTVIKLKVGDTFLSKFFEHIKENSTLCIVSKKVSMAGLENIEKFAKVKNIKIELLEKDPILEYTKDLTTSVETDVNYGLTTEEKIRLVTINLKNNEAIFTANQEEISYILNKRDFSKNYSSSVKRKKIFITQQGISSNISSGQIYADKKTTSAYDFIRLNAKALKTNPIKELKAIKTKDEIEHLKECFKKADKALLETRNFIENNNNISEFDIAKELEKNFYKNGAKSLSFKSIIAKDKNSAQAHYSKCSKDEILQDGSLVLIDCGAYFDGGLATDATRVFVKGSPSKLQKEVYTKVLKAFLNAISTKDVTTGFELDKIARNILDETKPKGFEFSHSLGHGIGISVHENPPSLSPSELGKITIQPFMCFTIEPGLYNEQHFGIRLENSCYLDDNYKIISFSNMIFEEKLIDYTLLTPEEKEVLKQWI